MVEVTSIIEKSNLEKLMEQGEELKLLHEEIAHLKEENLNLKTDNNTLRKNIYILKAEKASNAISEKAMKEKDEFIEKLSNDIINQQKDFNSYKTLQEANFEKEVHQVNLQQENLKYKMENISKIENLNNIFYYKILELEDIIKNFSDEKKKKLENMELKHQNKMAKFKKKMLDYLKDEHANFGLNSNKQNELNNKLNILHVQELKNELEYQSRIIENLLKEREILKRKVADLTNDVKIYMNVTNCLEQKNKEFQDKLHEISKPIKNNKSHSPNNNNINTFNISHSNNINSSSNHLISKNSSSQINLNNIIKFKPSPIIDIRNYHKKKNSSSNNNQSDKYLITKELLNKEKIKENYRLKYETAQSKLDFINKKYSNILKLYDSALEKIYNNYINKNNENIYLNLEDFSECDFEKMNPEQKYAVLVQMINTIFPIVNKNSIESEFLNQKIPTIKTKYYLGNNNSRTSNNFCHSNISLGENSTFGSSILDNFAKNSVKAFKKIKMEPLSELSYRRAKILLQDNQIRLKTFSIFD